MKIAVKTKKENKNVLVNLSPRPAAGTSPLGLDIETIPPHRGLDQGPAVLQSQEAGPLADDVVVAADVDLERDGRGRREGARAHHGHHGVGGAVGAGPLLDLGLDARGRRGVGLLVHQVPRAPARHAVLVLALELARRLVRQDGDDVAEAGDDQNGSAESESPFPGER